MHVTGRYRALLREFDDAIKELSALLSLLEELGPSSYVPPPSHGVKGIAFNSSAASDPPDEQTWSRSDLCVSSKNDAVPPPGGIAPRHGNSANEAMHHTFPGGQHAKYGIAQYVHIDIGIEAHREISPYRTGLYFQLEAAVVTSTRASKRGKNIPPEVMIHVLAQGGHFDQVIQSFRPPSLTNASNLLSVTAFGMRISLTRLQELLVAAVTKNPTLYPAKYLGVSRLVKEMSSLPTVLVVHNEDMANHNSLLGGDKAKGRDHKYDIVRTPGKHRKSIPSQMLMVMQTLRSAGIRASECVHQLQSPTPHTIDLHHGRRHLTAIHIESMSADDLQRLAFSVGISFIATTVCDVSAHHVGSHVVEPVVRIRRVLSPSTRDEEVVPLSAVSAYVMGHSDHTNAKTGATTRQPGSAHSGGGDKTTSSPRTDSLAANDSDMRTTDGCADSHGADTTNAAWKSRIILVERLGAVKDKKARFKEHNNSQKKVEMFLEDVVGVSTSSAKHIPVIATDLPFRLLRGLGTVMSDMVQSEGTKGPTHAVIDTLNAFLDCNNSHRRALKALLTEISGIKAEEAHGIGLQHIYLYSTADDRCDMVSYHQSVLSGCVLNITNVPVSPNRVVGSSKGKSR